MVGFGDMSTMTIGAIAYVSVTTLVGAVVHGIIVGQMMTVFSTANAGGAERDHVRSLMRL